MAEPVVLTELKDRILTLQLNRPDSLNAMTLDMIAFLVDTLHKADQDPEVRAILITGMGRGFCSGQDLSVASEAGAGSGKMDYGKHLKETLNPLILAIRHNSRPVIAGLNGVAAGAGMSLALACDYRIAAESAVFASAFINIALIPDAGSTWLLQRMVGWNHALDIMLTGRKVTMEEALAIGLVNRVVADSEFKDAVYTAMEQFAAAPTLTIGYLKKTLEFAATHTLEETLEFEAQMQARAGNSADHAEGISAFLNKRPPRFTGE